MSANPAVGDNQLLLAYYVLLSKAELKKGELVSELENPEGLRQQMLTLPKVLLHEHLDCSLRTQTMLEFWQEDLWKVPANFPASVIELFKTGRQKEAAAAYQAFLCTEASRSLSNYVRAIVHHVLPLMQTKARLARIAKERVEDAVSDGICGMELRFAPQLHTAGGLSMDEVMDAVRQGVASAPIALRLILCTLRHESASMAAKLCDLAIANKDIVGVFDLAGDEKANPGVLRWWAREAMRAREHGILVDIHLWETDEPTDEDLVRLEEFEITRLGHGMRGERQGERILEVCPSSNLVTGQLASLAEHPIDRLFKQGKRVTVNTDGTLFTSSDLSNEYLLLNKHFGWGNSEFLAVNKTAAEASSFTRKEKEEILTRLENSYRC